MISWKEIYTILSHVIPLYVVMILAYGSVKWWHIFTPNECSGINRFVMLFCAPLFAIKYILNNDPYTMNYHIVAADTLQKVIIIVILFLWCKLSSRGSFEWFITLFSLATLTNTLMFGIPLLEGMYGEALSENLMVALSVFQSIFWYPSMLFLYEYRKATQLVPWTCTEPEVVTTTSDSIDDESSSRDGENLGFDEERDIGVANGVHPSDSSEINEVRGGAINLEDAYQDHDHDQDQRGNASKGPTMSEMSSRTRVEVQPETQVEPKFTDMLPSGVTTRLILIMVWMKLIRNPNFYASIIAVVWSFISFRWHIKLPAIVMNSIKILSDAGLGVSMFSLGLFMASQPRIIAGGVASASLAVVMKFVVGPATMAATALVVGFRGTLLQITIVQGALPQAIVPFIYAREYDVHPDILGTSVGFGMLISLPIALVYYILLGLIIKQGD